MSWGRWLPGPVSFGHTLVGAAQTRKLLVRDCVAVEMELFIGSPFPCPELWQDVKTALAAIKLLTYIAIISHGLRDTLIYYRLGFDWRKMSLFAVPILSLSLVLTRLAIAAPPVLFQGLPVLHPDTCRGLGGDE